MHDCFLLQLLIHLSGTLLRKKNLKIVFAFTLTLLICCSIAQPFATVHAQTQDQSEYYVRSFSWNYGGETWVWNLSIPAALVDAYVSVPDSVRSQINLNNFGYFVTTEDSYLQSIAQRINETATQQGYSSLQEVNFALAMVQSIPYATDQNSTGYADYPRFPVETLFDDIGDCKSHSILFASLTLLLGFDCVFINPPDHLAVGVLGDNLSGTYFTYDGQHYYYSETTGEGFTVGQLPSQFNGVGVYVYPIDTSEQYVVNLQSESSASNPSYAPSNPNAPVVTPYLPPDSTTTSSPDLLGPTAVPIEPVSLNLIEDSPIFFTIIIVAVAICIAVVVVPIRRGIKPPTHMESSPEPTGPQPQEFVLNQSKYCIYCGASNKSIAVYCQNCGRKISDT